MIKRLLALLMVCSGNLVNGQITRNSELFQLLKKQDSIFFERSFNLCDMDYLTKVIHKDLIFFHDQAGIQNRNDFLENTKKNICSNPNQKPIRKLEESSLQVFPLYNNGILYGAIQSGIHNFYIREPNKEDVHTSTAKFIHVWLLENGDWLLKEVLSYDHKPPGYQYDSKKEPETVKSERIADHSDQHHGRATDKPTKTRQEARQLHSVFENYFALKDALVQSDGNLASAKANELLHALNGVQMNKLSNAEQNIWVKVMKNLKIDARRIEETKDVGRQRVRFNTLSENMYQLIKVSKQDTPAYYQHCPMANNGKGAYWLSKENAIKNPYYGSKMLTCGKTVETIE